MKKILLLAAISIGTLASAQSLTRDMTAALKNDDTQSIKSLVTDSNKNTCFEVGRSTYSLAQLAAQMQSSDVLLTLINEAQIDINQNCSGMSPLMSAVKTGQPHIVSILLEAGADKNLTIDGKKALDYINTNHKFTDQITKLFK